MATFAEWAGKAIELTITSNTTLSSRIRVQRITANSTGLDVALPDARRFQPGGPILVVWNSGSNSFDLTDNDGGTFKTLAANELVVCLLIDNSTAAGDWRGQIEATDTIPDAPVNDFFYTIGGVSGANQRTPYKYDHSLNSWASGTDATNQFIDVPGVESGGNGYLAAGTGSYPVEEYNPDTWTVKGNATRAPSQRSAAEDGGVGEWYGGQSTFVPGTAHDRYTISSDSWASGTAFPANHLYGAAEWAESGKIMVFGGTDSFASGWIAVQSNREHNTSTDAFSSKTDLPTDTRAELGHFQLGGDVFAVCGTVDHNGPHLDRLDSFNLAGNSWTTRQAWPDGLTQRGPACAARVSGTAYGAGGPSSVDANSYQVDTWTAIADHSSSAGQLRGAQDSALPLTI